MKRGSLPHITTTWEERNGFADVGNLEKWRGEGGKRQASEEELFPAISARRGKKNYACLQNRNVARSVGLKKMFSYFYSASRKSGVTCPRKRRKNGLRSKELDGQGGTKDDLTVKSPGSGRSRSERCHKKGREQHQNGEEEKEMASFASKEGGGELKGRTGITGQS